MWVLLIPLLFLLSPLVGAFFKRMRILDTTIPKSLEESSWRDVEYHKRYRKGQLVIQSHDGSEKRYKLTNLGLYPYHIAFFYEEEATIENGRIVDLKIIPDGTFFKKYYTSLPISVWEDTIVEFNFSDASKGMILTKDHPEFRDLHVNSVGPFEVPPTPWSLGFVALSVIVMYFMGKPAKSSTNLTAR